MDAFTVFAQSEHIFYSLFPKVKSLPPHHSFQKQNRNRTSNNDTTSRNGFYHFICMDHFSHPQAPPSKYNLPRTGRITSPLSRHWPITITTSPHICKTITVSAFTNSTTRVRIFNHCSKSSHSILCIVTCNGRKD